MQTEITVTSRKSLHSGVLLEDLESLHLIRISMKDMDPLRLLEAIEACQERNRVEPFDSFLERYKILVIFSHQND